MKIDKDQFFKTLLKTDCHEHFSIAIVVILIVVFNATAAFVTNAF